jgi:hypothetical protein
MWFLIFSQKIKLYIRLAIDTSTRKIIGFYLKNRSHKSGKKLWKSLPLFARQYAIAYPELLLIPNPLSIGYISGQALMQQARGRRGNK